MLHTQEVVVSVHPLVSTENLVLKPPFFPLLNEYYGRLFGVNYFFALTTTISPDERQLRF
jgi:hypothetical protein